MPHIEDYALIGDLQAAALVERGGSIDWLCFPRFDSGACFAALLGTPEHGRWLLAPVGEGKATRRYLHDTMVLETTWETEDGVVRVFDFMPPRGKAPDVVRIVEGVRGSVEIRSELVLRFDYGHVVPWVRRVGDTRLAVAGPDALCCRTPAHTRGENMRTISEFTIEEGERVPFALTWFPSHEDPPGRIDPEVALAETESFWREWNAKCTVDIPEEWRDLLHRSLMVLKTLIYAPTGGIVAAPTTSLPEWLGGIRNWDYRYCWLRDATLTLLALLQAGHIDEALDWRKWLLRAVAGDPSDIQIMYSVVGERRLTELELPWLPGYEGSAPVRIGNAAVDQRQLDVYGEVIDALSLGRQAGLRFDSHTWSLVRALLRFLEQNWDQPDEGIWEVRGPRRHFVHSKVMAWVAFDRAIHAAQLGAPGAEERWRAVRDTIHAEVCEKGYDARRGTFTQYYGSTELDAAVLLIPEVGFLPPDDPRVVSTVETIQRELVSNGLVLRYTQPTATSMAAQTDVDGLTGGEGAFLACSFWLANALHMIGRYDEAVKLFERLLALRNDLGLLSEEYDPRYSRQVGNFPQAFSHMPLIQSALNLEDHAGHHRRRPAKRASQAP